MPKINTRALLGFELWTHVRSECIDAVMTLDLFQQTDQNYQREGLDREQI